MERSFVLLSGVSHQFHCHAVILRVICVTPTQRGLLVSMKWPCHSKIKLTFHKSTILTPTTTDLCGFATCNNTHDTKQRTAMLNNSIRDHTFLALTLTDAAIPGSAQMIYPTLVCQRTLGVILSKVRPSALLQTREIPGMRVSTCKSSERPHHPLGQKTQVNRYSLLRAAWNSRIVIKGRMLDHFNETSTLLSFLYHSLDLVYCII
jgi:hypothetical protein